MKKLFLSFVMLMSCCMMFSQNEFEYISDGVDGSVFNVIKYHDVIEMDNGDFVMFGNKSSKNYFGRFSKTGELISETLRYDYLPGYNIANYEGLPILKADDGGFYVFTVYNPILDTSNANYQACFESKIIMEKLDEDFEYVYHKEMTIPVDTTNWINLWAHPSQNMNTFPEIQIGTVMDEGDGFVICYEKYTGGNGYGTHSHGYDSTFIIKTDYDLNIQKSGSLGHELCNRMRHRNHLLYDEEDNEYLYYVSGIWSEQYRRGFYLYRFDSDFNFIDDHLLPATEGLSQKAIYYRDRLGIVTAGITLKRTSSNKTIMMAGADDHHVPYGHYTAAVCVLMDDEARMLDSITFARVESASGYSTSAPSLCSIDWVDEDRIFIGATPYMYHSEQLHNSRQQYFIIKMIDKDLNVLDERYYDLGETTGLFTHLLKATNDGGCMIAGHFKDFGKDPDIYYNVIKKFPPEAFDGIEEPHAHGLKLAVAYPNPGGDVMNIRTTLRDCNLTVYDMQGRMVHQQEITDDVTSIDASKWTNGTYVWKLGMRNEKLGMKEVESGKWIKGN